MDDRRGRLQALIRQFGTQAGGPQATKVLEDIVGLLRNSLGDDEISRGVQEQFLEFIADKTDVWKQHPRLSSACVDTIIDSMLLICNRNPSALAARSMQLLTQMLGDGASLLDWVLPSPGSVYFSCDPSHFSDGGSRSVCTCCLCDGLSR